VGVLDASNSSSASSFNRMGSRTSYVRSAANSRAAYINSGVAQNYDCQPRLFGLTQCSAPEAPSRAPGMPRSPSCRASSRTSLRSLAQCSCKRVAGLAVQTATEKSRGKTTVTLPVHPEFVDSLRAAQAAAIVGAEVFTRKMVKDRVLPMKKEAWAAKFKIARGEDAMLRTCDKRPCDCSTPISEVLPLFLRPHRAAVQGTGGRLCRRAPLILSR
jgi:hypothetical protein